MRIAAYVVLGTLLFGCGNGSTAPAPNPTVAPPPANTDNSKILELKGPGGTVALGDSSAKAKLAFPPLQGATVFNSTMSFITITKEGWAWGVGSQAFEIATKGDKVIDIAVAGNDAGEEPASTIAALGKPSRSAQGKTVTMDVWESGDSARFVINVKGSNTFIPAGVLTLIGKKDDLKLLNYRADDPDTFVKQMDIAAEKMNSPEMKKMMEDAKTKANAKKK